MDSITGMNFVSDLFTQFWEIVAASWAGGAGHVLVRWSGYVFLRFLWIKIKYPPDPTSGFCIPHITACQALSALSLGFAQR